MFARYPQPHWSAWGNEADESVTPQGKVYKGYTGGEIENMPPLENHERLTRESELAVGKLLRDEYESGRSIKDLAAEHDYSIARVRRYLSLVAVLYIGRHSVDMTMGFHAFQCVLG